MKWIQSMFSVLSEEEMFLNKMIVKAQKTFRTIIMLDLSSVQRIEEKKITKNDITRYFSNIET